MTDKSTPTKKEFLSNDKTSNNISTSTNILNQENILPLPNLTNTENFQNKSTQNFTFKIIKRRAPWNKKEDEAIIELVNKYGTSNWTIIANEMAAMYKSKHRNGKQCRERWHNHLDPIVNKENWTEEEENILFNKHMEYGNKWSDISKYLPGRTDNSIKNHFYSKLRKFIRKILKQINKENLLKNNGIDYYKYNSDKVYKLLKKYKITYKNVTKETILNLIIATEKNQKNKIFGLNDDKINNNITNGSNGKNSELQNIPFNLDNNLITNSNDKQSRNNSGSKLMNKSNLNKKSKIKSKSKSNEEINGNQLLIKKDKKIFQSSIVTEIKPIKNDLIENKNNNILLNQINNRITNKNTRKYKRKNKNLENSEDKKDTKKENLNNENNNIDEENDINNNKKKLTINTDYIQQTSKLKQKSKSKIKEKGNINGNENKKLLNKKRRRKKRRKVTISLSTPENKKDQINRIMPRRNFIFGLGQRLPIRNKLHKKNSNKINKFEISPEDFDPTINEVEYVREGLEIHSKYIILINKNLLTEKIFPETNYEYKPNINLNMEFPLSPKIPQFPINIPRTMKNGDENNYMPNFNERNISIGLPTPMDGLYEGQISPVGPYNLIMFPPPSTKNIYNVDFGIENKFLRKNYQPYTPKNFINGPMLTPNTPKKEINLQNKILIQNNNNINDDENNDDNNIQEKSKKPTALNLDIINNFNNENNNAYTGYSFFGGNEMMSSSIAKQNIPTPANIFNLSPTSPFIPRIFGDKNL